MTRVKRGFISKKRRKKILAFAKGFVGSHSKLFRTANQQILKSLKYSFSDRRKKKNQNKRIWIIRINAFARDLRIKYNLTVLLLKLIKIIINKKILSEIGKTDPIGYMITLQNVLLYFLTKYS